jgi:hypothetical protein
MEEEYLGKLKHDVVWIIHTKTITSFAEEGNCRQRPTRFVEKALQTR